MSFPCDSYGLLSACHKQRKSFQQKLDWQELKPGLLPTERAEDTQLFFLARMQERRSQVDYS
jgi:hypothetical protein